MQVFWFFFFLNGKLFCYLSAPCRKFVFRRWCKNLYRLNQPWSFISWQNSLLFWKLLIGWTGFTHSNYLFLPTMPCCAVSFLVLSLTAQRSDQLVLISVVTTPLTFDLRITQKSDRLVLICNFFCVWLFTSFRWGFYARFGLVFRSTVDLFNILNFTLIFNESCLLFICSQLYFCPS